MITDEPTTAVEFTLAEMLVLVNTACLGALVALSPSDPAIPPLMMKIRALLHEFQAEAWNELICRIGDAAEQMPGAQALHTAAKWLNVHPDLDAN